jgi:hypothetical protein
MLVAHIFGWTIRPAHPSHRRKSRTPPSKRRAQKLEAIESLLEVTSWISSEKREPNELEQMFLVRALASISSGCYVLGKTQARLAQASAEQRSLKPNPPAKLARKYNLAQIGLRLQEVAAEPLSNPRPSISSNRVKARLATQRRPRTLD